MDIHNTLQATNAWRSLQEYINKRQPKLKKWKTNKVHFSNKYIDLGLPSGTLWKNENEEGFFNFKQAIAMFGKRVPSLDQFEELFRECHMVWDEDNVGYKITGPNGNEIFLPAKGRTRDPFSNESSKEWKDKGCYWTSSIVNQYHAYELYFNHICHDIHRHQKDSRYYAGKMFNCYSIRLVKS